MAAKADLGVIFDCDGDRGAVVFSDGTEVNRNTLIALLGVIVAEQAPGSTIVTDSVTSDELAVFLTEELGLKPLFDLEMRLGEGSGVPVAMTILDAACAVMNEMATFPEAGIDDGYLDPIRADPRSLGGETEGGR